MHKRNVLTMIDHLHQQWEVPRYDLTTNPHRLVPLREKIRLNDNSDQFLVAKTSLIVIIINLLT